MNWRPGNLNWRLVRIKHAPVDKLNPYRIDHCRIATSLHAAAYADKRTQFVVCESASNLDPWRIRYNALRLNAFRQKRWGHDRTPIERARNKKFQLCFNNLVLNRDGSKLDADSEFAKVRLAHVLMLSGNRDEARPIYDHLRAAKIRSQFTCAELILQDFKSLREHKREDDLMGEIETLYNFPEPQRPILIR
jgi:hypothetical protein